MSYFYYDSIFGPKIQTSAFSLSPALIPDEANSSSSIISPPTLPRKKNALKRGRSSPGQPLFSPDLRHLAPKAHRVDTQTNAFSNMSSKAEIKLSEVKAIPIQASQNPKNLPPISPSALFFLSDAATSRITESKEELKIRILPPRTNNFGIAFLSESDNQSSISLPKPSKGIRELSNPREFDQYFGAGKKVEEDTWATSLSGKQNLYVSNVLLGVVIAAYATQNNDEVIRTGLLDIVDVFEPEKALQHKIRSFLRNMQHTQDSQVSLFVAGGAGTHWENNKICRILRKILSEQEFASRGTAIKSHLINPWNLNSFEDEAAERLIDQHNISLSIGIRKGDPMIVDNTTLEVDTIDRNGVVGRSKMSRPQNCNFADVSHVTVE